MNGERVLVTGGSGFVGSHCILQLLAAGYQVRTTVRSLKREQAVREMLSAGGAGRQTLTDRLEFVAADLTQDAGWPEAVQGCDYVLHVASPFPMTAPKHEDELIIPAREGSLRVLRAARNAGVKRVVLTSSFVAIGYGHAHNPAYYTETDWTDISGPGLTAYAKSKTLAERAAWDFIEHQGRGLELAVVNPVGIFGPALGSDYAASVELIRRMISGQVPALPRLYPGIVDVRDVADLHLRAMTNPNAKGQRFLAVAGDVMSAKQLADALHQGLGPAVKRLPKYLIPDWVVRLAARFDPSMALLVPELGKIRNASNAKARRLLGWTPRSNEEAILASAESLIKLGLAG